MVPSAPSTRSASGNVAKSLGHTSEATEAEQIANAEKAAAVREASIQQSEYQAQMDQARSRLAPRRWRPTRTLSSRRYAENYPAIVAAAASSLGNIDNLVDLNGAEGMEDLLAEAMTMGGAGLGLAKQLMTSIRSDKPANASKKFGLPVAELKGVPYRSHPATARSTSHGVTPLDA